jgi:hypothetical protein
MNIREYIMIAIIIMLTLMNVNIKNDIKLIHMKINLIEQKAEQSNQINFYDSDKKDNYYSV